MKGGKHRASWKVRTESDFLNERQNKIKKEQNHGIVSSIPMYCVYFFMWSPS